MQKRDQKWSRGAKVAQGRFKNSFWRIFDSLGALGECFSDGCSTDLGQISGILQICRASIFNV